MSDVEKNYAVPAKLARSEIIIKKSRFIASLLHVTSREAVSAYLVDIRKEFMDASHHCWGYQLGHPEFVYNSAMSDDGEPSGTAGGPILNVMKYQPVGDCLVVVSRFYGGVKLGAGGLVRAYSSAAKLAYDHVVLQQHVSLLRLKVCIQYSDEQFLRHWLSTVAGQLDDIIYNNMLVCCISIPDEAKSEFDNVVGSRHWTLTP